MTEVSAASACVSTVDVLRCMRAVSRCMHAQRTKALHATQNSAEARCAHNEKRGRLVSPSEPVTALRSGPNSTRKVRATPKPLPSLTAQPRISRACLKKALTALILSLASLYILGQQIWAVTLTRKSSQRRDAPPPGGGP